MDRTEEDIKVNIVIPYLRSLGFTEDELKFEQSFIVHLGRYAVRIDSGQGIRTGHPRLDILITRNGSNLCVLEVKTDSKPLTEHDRDQAISYSRLVHPMAPVAIVTNGLETVMYDSFTKRSVQRDKSEILSCSAPDDLRLAYEDALEYFMGYSKENIAKFSFSQVSEGMKTLSGSKDDRDKKFIKELYVESNVLSAQFQSFLESSKTVFGIVGDSGVGKTCGMCGLALRYVNSGYLVLFYRAQEILQSITNSIATDCNWTFSLQLGDIAVVKRLCKLFRSTPVLVFIEAIDDWASPDKSQMLDNFIKTTSGTNIRLVVSCKSGEWPDFVSRKGVPSYLSQCLYSREPARGYAIEPFNRAEFSTLMKKYRDFYGFRGEFENRVLEECRRLPFMLRVFFEVAEEKEYSHITFSVKEFFDRYYQKLLERLDRKDREVAERVLRHVAKLQFDNNEDPISETAVREALGLGLQDKLPEELFHAHILQKVRVGAQNKLTFYFKKLRDYIIAFHSEGWDQLCDQDLDRKWDTICRTGVPIEAATLFYQLCDQSRKTILASPLSSKAEEYLSLYRQTIKTHFPNLVRQFSPGSLDTAGIGFIGIWNPLQDKLTSYGFRIIAPGDEAVVLIPSSSQSFWGDEDSNLPSMLGGRTLHFTGSSDGFRNIDIKKEVIENEIVPQLIALIDHGMLNETSSFALSVEKALGLIVALQGAAHCIENHKQISPLLPISIDKVEYEVRYARALRHLKHNHTKEQIEKGLIPVTLQDNMRSYKPSFTNEDSIRIANEARRLASENVPFTSCIRYPQIEALEQILLEAVKTLRLETEAIRFTILPDEDSVPTPPDYRAHGFYKQQTLIEFASKVFALFLQSYKSLIESNFPTLKGNFDLYAQMPVRWFVVIRPDRNFSVEIYNCTNEGIDKNEMMVCSPTEARFDVEQKMLTVAGRAFKVKDTRHIGIDSLLFPSRDYIPNVHRDFTVLRHMVYERIRREVGRAIVSLRSQVGLS